MAGPHDDVVVVGAGPAGCAAAIVLHQAGLRVCLVDDVVDTARKVGESLPGAASRLLHRLGIVGLDSLIGSEEYHPCMANVSAWGTDEWTRKDAIYNPEGGGWHLCRQRFDAALRQHAIDTGVTIHRRKVDQLAKQTTGVDVTLSDSPDCLHAHWVIDATGRSSSVLKQFGIKRTRLDAQMAAVGWIRCPNVDCDNITRIKSVSDGWWYTSKLPMGERVLVFHSLPDTIASLRQDTDAFLNRLGQTDLLSHQVTAKDLISAIKATDAGVSRPEHIAAEGCLAVGDAALSFDPLSSQGIFFALYSGVRGAEALIGILTDSDQRDDALTHYSQQVERVFQANQNSRLYHYASETRFSDHPYWRSRSLLG